MNKEEIMQHINRDLANYNNLSLTDKMIVIDSLIDNLTDLYNEVEDELYNSTDQVVYNPNSNVVPFKR